MANQQPIIRRKKIIAGHGHHGGAWKVAYADFVTAMMAFFLVMWLMGVDEETKAEISHYFTHPNQVYQKGGDAATAPQGMPAEATNRPTQGESVLDGKNENLDALAFGSQPQNPNLNDFQEIGQKLNEALGDQAFGVEVDLDSIKFKIAEPLLLIPKTSQLEKNAPKVLNRVGSVLKGFKGRVTIENHSDETFLDGQNIQSRYQASIVKSVEVMNYLINHLLIQEERIQPIVPQKNAANASKPSAKESEDQKNYFEFMMKRQ
jgi:chemotaxis protein MotB